MTIEERANNYVENTHSPSNASEFQYAMNLAVCKGYIQGATDQQKIDFNKACEWLYKHCSGTSEYQLTAGGQIIPHNEFVEQFKEAMEK